MKKYLYSIAVNLFFIVPVFSQSVGIIDFMRLNPYSNLNNPANFIPYNGYIAIPAISNINLSIYNSDLFYKNIIEINADWKPTLNLDKFAKSSVKNNWLNTGASIELLGFGFRIKKSFFSFNYRLIVDGNFKYSKDFFGFLLYDDLAKEKNGESLYSKNNPAVLDINPNISIYQELSIGFQREILKNFYIGLRPKILFGIYNIKTDNFYAKVYSDPTDYTVFGAYNVSINMASAIPFYNTQETFSLNTPKFNTKQDILNLMNDCFSKNLGFAIDFGAVFRINQHFRVSASVTDLGFIKWKGSPINMSIKPLNNGEYTTISDLTTKQVVTSFKNGISIDFDSIANFTLKEIPSYKSMLTSKIMVDGCIDFTPSHRLILQCKGYILGKDFIPQLTVAYNGTFLNLIDLVVSYSILKNSYSNLGVGFGVRLGPVHLYAGTDNVLAAIHLVNAKKVNATAGLLIDFPVSAKVKESNLKCLFPKNKRTTNSEPVKETVD